MGRAFPMSTTQGGPAACRSYPLACDRTRDGLLADARMEDVKAAAARVERARVRLPPAVDAHAYSHHVSGGRVGGGAPEWDRRARRRFGPCGTASVHCPVSRLRPVASR